MSSNSLIMMSIKYIPVVEYQALLRSFVTVLLQFLLWHPICLSCRATTHGQRRIWLLSCVPAAIASFFHQADLVMFLQFWATRPQDLCIVPPRSNSLWTSLWHVCPHQFPAMTTLSSPVAPYMPQALCRTLWSRSLSPSITSTSMRSSSTWSTSATTPSFQSHLQWVFDLGL